MLLDLVYDWIGKLQLLVKPVNTAFLESFDVSILKIFEGVRMFNICFEMFEMFYAYLCASTVASIKSSSCDHESMIDFDVEENKSKKWQNSKYHCLKNIHVIFDVHFAVSENEKKSLGENLYYMMMLDVAFMPTNI